MKKKIYIFMISFITISIAFFAYNFFTHTKTQETEAALSRNGLTLDLNFGNNDGTATPTVYDTSGFDRHATSTAGNSPTCNDSFCDFSGANGNSFYANYPGIIGSTFSLAIKFSPDFNYDLDSAPYLFRFQNSSTFVSKRANVESNALRIDIAGVNIANIPSATYAPYWKIGEENILIIIARDSSDLTNVYFNGYQILSSSVDWTNGDPTILNIGSHSVGAADANFDGSIHYLKVWNRLLTDTEIANLSADRQSTTQAPTRKGLVGHWDMDSNNINGTTVLDKSGQNNHGVGTNITSDDLVAGKIGQALDFDGSTEYITVNDNPSLQFTENTPFTVSLWFKGKNTDGVGSSELLAKRNGNDRYDIYLDASDFLNFTMGDGTNVLVVADNKSVNDNQWHNVIEVYNGANLLTGYLDGALIGTDNSPTLSGLDNSGANLTIGKGPNDEFDGSLDDVRIYNYALSADEISNLYNSAKSNYIKSPTRNGLVGHWTMDRGDINSTTVLDKSGQNNHGVGTNITPSDLVSGKIKDSLDFDGSTEKITVGSGRVYNFDTNPFTISAWIKTVDNASTYAIANETSDGTPYVAGDFLFRVSSGKLQFIRRHGTSDPVKQWNSTSDVPIGKWVHVVGVYNGSDTDGDIYIDNIKESPVAISNSVAGLTEGTYIGAMGSTLTYFKGSLDDVRVYNYALSAEEVSTIYNSSKKVYIK